MAGINRICGLLVRAMGVQLGLKMAIATALITLALLLSIGFAVDGVGGNRDGSPYATKDTTAPHLPTTTAVAAASMSAYPTGVWRDDFANGHGAPPLFFKPLRGNCVSNGLVNDGGSCINSHDGNSFKAVFSHLPDIKQWGAVGDGSTDDTAALQAFFNFFVANSGFGYLSPAPICYKVTSTVTINRSGPSPKYLGLRGAGPESEICSSIGSRVLAYVGSGANDASYFSISDVHIVGNDVTPAPGSVGFYADAAAYVNLTNVNIEGFDNGVDGVDTDQWVWINDHIRFNNTGIHFGSAVTFTGANSMTFVSTEVANNFHAGVTALSGLAFNYYGGIIANNGVTGSEASTDYGIRLGDLISGSAIFDGVDFEGNGGIADVVLDNISSSLNVKIVGGTFIRYPTGYATNHILVKGTHQAMLCKRCLRTVEVGA